jgi:uncharacterized lipoprotein YmbA
MRVRAVTAPSVFVLSVVCLLFVVGCSARGAVRTEYVLSSVAVSGPVAGTAVNPIISVGPVELPEYLDRPQIVTREAAGRLRASESHVWAEGLEAGLVRVIVDNLAHWVPSTRVRAFLSPLAPSADYRVEVRVSAFEVDASREHVALDAYWTLVNAEDGRAIASRNIRVQEPVQGGAYDDIVTAYDAAVGKLSRDIADALREARL